MFFSLVGEKEGNASYTPPVWLPVGLFTAGLDNAISKAPSAVREIDSGSCLRIETSKLPASCPEGLPPSMKRAAFQLFLTKSRMSTFSISLEALESMP